MTQTAASGASRSTVYTYDRAGQLIQATLPGGQQLAYAYDAAHNLRTITDNLGNRIEYNYDLRGNRVQEYVRDLGGNLVRSVETAYDLRNRVSSINTGGSVTQLVHDAIGNLLTRRDPKGQTTAHGYDPLNRLIQTLDALGGRTAYGLDPAGRPVQVAAPNGATTRYDYDDLGNLLKETSPDRGTTTYTHDPAGNLIAMTDARGVRAAYSYDALNRLSAVSYTGGALASALAPLSQGLAGLVGTRASAEDVVFSYDHCPAGRGRLCAVQDEAGTSQYAYDGFGNLAAHTRNELGVSYTMRYSYDAADRLSALTYPDGRVMSYARDALGRLEALSATVEGVNTAIVSNRRYRADGRLAAQRFGNGLGETRSHDLQGRLTEQALGAEIRRYSYDPNGNLLTRQGPVQGDAEGYDALDRLTQETRSGRYAGSEAYTYDANGNRLARGGQSYGYGGGSNRLSQVNGLALTLDAAGNILTDQNGWSYSYNLAGRLKQATVGSKPKDTIGYSYNAFGNRTRKLQHPNTTVYHYDREGRLIAETDDRGRPQVAYLWDDEGPIAQIARPHPNKETLVFLHTDHLNTPRSATDAQGKTVWRWEGSAFGETLPEEDPDQDRKATTVNLRFPGQYYDGETGLYYNWHRYYDPKTGRFPTVDPLGILPGYTPAPSVARYLMRLFRTSSTNDLLLRGINHPYVYASSNPLRFTDPTGLAWYGNWCGPGGSGEPKDCSDRACKKHDECYDACGLDASSRWLPKNITNKCAYDCDRQLTRDVNGCRTCRQ